MSFTASATSGFLVTARRLLRRRAWLMVVVAAGAAFGLAWALGNAVGTRRAAWTESVLLFGPLFAVGVGAYGGQLLRGRRRGTPLAAAPLAPAGWVVGQSGALVAAVLLATAVLAAPGAVFFGEGLASVRGLGPPQVRGECHADHGRTWTRPGRGALVWALPVLGPGERDAVLRFDTAFYRNYAGDPIVVRVDGETEPVLRATIRTDAPLRVRLPDSVRGGELVLTCETAGVATAAVRDGAWLVDVRGAGGASGWVALWWLVAAHGLLLGAAALAASMLVSPPIALLAALTVWLTGWASRFLADYAEAADLPSVFAAWSGAAAESASGPAWLPGFAAVIRWVPDLSGTVVTEALGRGFLPEWGRLAGTTAPHLAAALGLVLAAALIGAKTWKRSPGRIPGERGLF